MLSEIKHLENINDFPKVGLLYLENSGENLLRFYIEKIFKIKTGENIKITSDRYINDNCDLFWIIASDFPLRNKEEYNKAFISSAILLVRNPVDLIMSKILRDSFFFEEAFHKVDQMIEDWKEFYKYWLNAPIPIHIIRYEDIIEETDEILRQLCKFLLGIKNLENSKLENFIKIISQEKVSKEYYAYDIEIKEKDNLVNKEMIKKFQEKFYLKLKKMLIKFNYEINDNNVNDVNWLIEFNKDNLIKAVEFNDYVSNQYMTLSYTNVKLG